MWCVRPMTSSPCVHTCIHTYMHMYTHAVILQLVPTAVYTPGLCVSAPVQVPSRYLLVHDSSPDGTSTSTSTSRYMTPHMMKVAMTVGTAVQ